MTRRPRVAVALLLCLWPTLAGCGTQLSDAAIEQAAGGRPVAVAASGQTPLALLPATSGALVGPAHPGAAPVAAGANPSGAAAAGRPGAAGQVTGGGAAPAAAGGGGASTGGPDILLGNVGQYSGPIGSSLAGAQPALQVWARWTNAHGGILGRQVKVLSANDQGDPSSNKTLVQTQVEQNKVVAFVGNQVPLSVQGGLSYLQDHQIPVVGGDGSTPSWTQSPMLFPQGESNNNIIASLASVTVKAGKTKAAIIYCVESPGNCGVAKTQLADNGVAAKLGLTITNTEQVSLTQPDFTQQCIRSQTAGAQAMLIFADANTVGRVADSCAAQNYKPQFVTGSLAVTNGLAANTNLEGLLAPQPWFGWPLQNAATADYRSALAQFAPSLEASSATASAWSAGQLIKMAIEASGVSPGTAVGSADVLRGLYTIRNRAVPGLTPLLTFNAGKPATPSNCAFTVAITNGRFVATDGGVPSCLSENFG